MRMQDGTTFTRGNATVSAGSRSPDEAPTTSLRSHDCVQNLRRPSPRHPRGGLAEVPLRAASLRRIHAVSIVPADFVEQHNTRYQRVFLQSFAAQSCPESAKSP